MKKLLILFLLIIFSFTLHAQKKLICDETGSFSEGFVSFKLNGKWGFANENGDVVIEPRLSVYLSDYGDYPCFKEGLVRVYDPDTERVGFMNTKGEMVLPYQYYSAEDFSENVAIVGLQNDYVIIDTQGKVLASDFAALNAERRNFSEGLACIQKDEAMGYMNKKGMFAIAAEFAEARSFSDSLAIVKNEQKWGAIDHTGAVKVDFQFTKEPMPFSCKRSFIQGTNNTWGIMDRNGKIIITPKYNQVFPFSEGAAVVSEMDATYKETFFIIDVNGGTIKAFPKSTNSAETITFYSGFNDGYAVAFKNGKKGLIDKKGNVFVGFQYRDIKPMQSAMAYFERYDEKTKSVTKGYLNKAGKEAFIIEKPQF